MQRFLLLFAYGFLMTNATTFDKAIQEARCLLQCANKTCEEVCKQLLVNDLQTLPSLRSITKKTKANTRLYCRGAHDLTISHHPGIYIVEESFLNSPWMNAKVTKGNYTTFSKLNTSTAYRFRLYRVTTSGLCQPDISRVFKTFQAKYIPKVVKNISLDKLEVNKRNISRMEAHIKFEPAEDISCSYTVLVWSREHQLSIYKFKSPKHYIFHIPVDYDQLNTIFLISRNEEYGLESKNISFTFVSPLCVEVHKNLNTCAPPVVEGLRVNTTFDEYSIKIEWDPPKLQPDNFTIFLQSISKSYLHYKLNVTGNTSEAILRNIYIGQRFKVGIVAVSQGGISPIEVIYSEIYDDTYEIKIIGFSILIFGSVLIPGFIFARYKFKKRNKYRSRYTYVKFQTIKETSSKVIDVKGNLKCNHSLKKKAFLSQNELNIKPEQLVIKKTLGNGEFGIVKLGVLQYSKSQKINVAVKMLKEGSNEDDKKNFQQEILTMKSVGMHPNIVSMIISCNVDNNTMLILEYCSKGNLLNYLRSVWEKILLDVLKKKIPEKNENDFRTVKYQDIFSKNITYQNLMNEFNNDTYDLQIDLLDSTKDMYIDFLNFARQVAAGMNFLSSKRIVHRDLATRNVLVTENKTAKIADFGLSRDIYLENVYKKKGNGILPIKWMAIESLIHKIYTTQSDVWSYGVLLWEIFTYGSEPYLGISSETITSLLNSGYRMDQPLNCTTQLYNVMLACWHNSPNCRPTFAELKQYLEQLLCTAMNHEYLDLDSLEPFLL